MLLLPRWTPPAGRAGRIWRAIVITVLAVVIALAWPVATMLGIVAAIIGLLGRPSRRPPWTPHPYPSGQVTTRPRGHRFSPTRGRSAEDDYWDQRAREERDQRFAQQYEADMYRWGDRHHPPPGY